MSTIPAFNTSQPKSFFSQTSQPNNPRKQSFSHYQTLVLARVMQTSIHLTIS